MRAGILAPGGGRGKMENLLKIFIKIAANNLK